MNILWGVIGIIALVGLATLVLFLPFGAWKNYQFEKMLRENAKSSKKASPVLDIRPGWRRKIAMTHYMMTKRYEQESDPRLKDSGRHMRRIGNFMLVVSVVTIGLFIAIFVAAPR
jgi:hypothetical protein